ncbi:MAG TPA: biotin--[acetyl-CoA-carboxylase] ligase [Ottowia sp.]|uniref:biotin--[acetyl-CoA-carboxylase] ligase n=1 Tax=Ottowia sp. TaxID=1898956 RepID=UPI002C396348|nr:biotin--[acetyl-CoA-carboxylase] ligase [Ottowia sp.]HMN21664.1 biotin--[acetyl-CoA-carboxylase] ligase [Ottowia sp.]
MTQPLRLDWPRARLTASLAALWPGLAVEIVPTIDSTNTELMRRVRAGALAPTLLVAETQDAARGRLGRAWDSGAPGAALSFSLGLPLAPRDWSGLSLAAGLAVAESLHPAIGLKWPNDLWWQGRKLAGVLVETAGGPAPDGARVVVIGVGLNLQVPADAGFSTAPAGLQALLPGIGAPDALLRIAPALVQAVQAFERVGFAPLLARYAARDVLAGQGVRLSDGTQGEACGLAPDGALRVRTPQGLREVRSAEVSVRPMAAPETPGAGG